MSWLLVATAVVVAAVIWTLRKPLVERAASFSPVSINDILPLVETES
ncbi:MAG: hypothetical protein VX095_00755 [Pseudomonadota bacterium]|nr:hypothetical protein [Pseudomonadota bacterium]